MTGRLDGTRLSAGRTVARVGGIGRMVQVLNMRAVPSPEPSQIRGAVVPDSGRARV